jgi:cephalosporin-C deacetylase-like acetyl esterase
MAVEEVEFTSGGETVRGDLYLPEGPGPFPAVVMAGGWCYVKELRQPQYAKRFVDSGFAALIFDYRRLGASDGEPRQHLDPWDQIEDYRNAISYLEGRQDIDSGRIGAWGISYSGGHVLILAAIDPRVRAVVANVPVVEGYETMWRVHGTERFRMLKEVIHEDRRKRFETGEYGSISMSGSVKDGLAAWPLQEVKTVFDELKKTQAPRHEHWSTIASVESLLAYDVMPYARRIIDVPVLMIVADGDDITNWDLELGVFEAIPAQKKSHLVLPKTTHMTLYSNLTALDLAAAAATDWFEKHLEELPSVETEIARFRASRP